MNMSDAFDDESDGANAGYRIPTPPRSDANPAAKKKPGRPKTAAASACGARPNTRRKSSDKIAAQTTKPLSKREALKDISNTEPADGDETEEVDDFDVLSEDVPGDAQPPQQPTPLTQSKIASKSRGRKPKANMEDAETKPKRGRAKKVEKEPRMEEISETQPDVSASSKLAKGATKGTKKPPKPAKREIPETQPEPEAEAMDIDRSAVPELAEQKTLPGPRRPSPDQRATAYANPSHRAVSRSGRRQPSVATGRYARAGSTSDNDRNNDASLRRKLNNMTQKFESLQSRYDTLRDVGIKDAETNFERLKRATDEKSKAADALIAKLRRDNAAQTTQIEESKSLQTRVAELEASDKTAESSNKQVSASLAAAQNEIKTLQAKLSATRSASHPVEAAGAHGKTPGSAVKNKLGGVRTVMVGSTEAAKDAQKMIMKEDLYGDLTGIIIRDVKKGDEGEDIYDCIQTGRNGSKLSKYICGLSDLQL